MKTFEESLKERLKNPEFKKEWDALEYEFRQIRQDLAIENNYPDNYVKEIEKESGFSVSYAL